MHLKVKLNYLLLLLAVVSVAFFGLTHQNDNRVVTNINAVPTNDGVKIFSELVNDSSELEVFYLIRYISQEDFINEDAPQWTYSNYYRYQKDSSILLKGLDVEKDYFYSIALVKDTSQVSILKSEIEWSGLHTFEKDKRWEIQSGIMLHILVLFGALALFIFGMKRMSEGIQKLTGRLLRQLISKINVNRLSGMITGFLTTSLIQSSSATTVMAVSFVNNGLLTLKQSIAVIMGANIGTTITAWLIVLIGFNPLLQEYALIVFLVAMAFIFSSKTRNKPWGELFVGIALLLLGLAYLGQGIPDVRHSIEQLQFLNSLAGATLWSLILATLIGAVITVLFQSSIAVLVLVLLLCARGIIPYEMGLGMVLGSNIGTTITANTAAMVGNKNAKRAARAHLFFNLFGTVWMIIVYPLFVDCIEFIVVDVFNMSSPQTTQSSTPVALALFHTLFNLFNAFIMFWMIDFIASSVVKFVPDQGDEDDVVQLGFIKAGILSTPELTILEAKKEIAKFGKITSKMSGFFQRLLVETDKNKKRYLYDKIARYEEITDKVELELTDYLSQTSETEMSEDTSQKVRAMMAIANYLERIGDLFYQMSLTLERKEKQKIWFSPEQRMNLQKMLRLIDEAFVIMINNMNVGSEEVSYIKALRKEQEIDMFRDTLRTQHFTDIEKQEYNIKSGIIYSDLFFSCEKIGDHIMNITEALTNDEVSENTSI